MLQERTPVAPRTMPIAVRAESERRLRWIPWGLAVFFVLWSLRAVGAGNIVDTDAARHAMNGAFIHDMLRDGGFWNPIEYGKNYYGHLPALSLPYHPPLFPGVEALFFALFGVSVTSARVLVALATGLSAFLFYRLIVATHRSHLLAAFSVTTFLFWKSSQVVAGDVMLELPSMALIAGALLCIRNLDQGLSWKNALGFAILAAAAAWTKQHAVFLGLAPFAYYLFRMRPRLWFQKRLLAASVLFGVAVIALSLLSVPFQGTGVDHIPPQHERVEIAIHNAGFYIACFRDLVGTIPAILILCVVLAAAFVPGAGDWAGKSGLAFYWAWAASAFLLLLIIGAYDIRYLFYVYPALAVIVYASLFRLGSRISVQRAWMAPAAVAAVCATAGLMVPALFLRGPAEAAEVVMKTKPQRILYCGSTDGNFIFSVRAREPGLRTTVIPGDKLNEKDLSPDTFEQFATQHGIQYIVLEKTGRPQLYDRLHQNPAPFMILERRIPMASSLPRWDGGHLSIYRIAGAPDVIPKSLKLPIPKIGRDVDVKF